MKQWLACSGLRDVECEDVTVEQRYEWRVCVGFEGFTLQIRETFGSKKEAIRHAYLRLGLAGQFCHQDGEFCLSVCRIIVVKDVNASRSHFSIFLQYGSSTNLSLSLFPSLVTRVEIQRKNESFLRQAFLL